MRINCEEKHHEQLFFCKFCLGLAKSIFEKSSQELVGLLLCENVSIKTQSKNMTSNCIGMAKQGNNFLEINIKLLVFVCILYLHSLYFLN